jgi:GNAT superfamily N-acetyltransferase
MVKAQTRDLMLEIRKVDESNKQWIIDYLRQDVVRHVFAFYDLQHDPEHTTMYAAFEDDDRLSGYILIYAALEFPSVVLECDVGTVGKLIEHAPSDHFIMHAQSNLLAEVESRFPNAKHYIENWMMVKKGEADFSRSEHVRKLNAADGSRLTALLPSRKDSLRAVDRKYADWVRRMPTYGVFMDGDMVSYAGSFIQTPQIWMIGGVYTDLNHRNRGYATLATSAITEEALRKSDAAALFVRSDNYPAISVYEKIGYKKIGEKLWIDVGTGMKP